MKTQGNISGIILILLSTFFMQGCTLALAAAGGYAVTKAAVSKTESTTNSKEQAYLNYKVEMEKLNAERGKNGQKRDPIMTYDEWLKSQGITNK